VFAEIDIETPKVASSPSALRDASFVKDLSVEKHPLAKNWGTSMQMDCRFSRAALSN